jgi:hypothetical protein
MDCAEALERLNARLDGELAGGDEALVEAHLAGCAECRAADEALRQLDAQMRRATAPARQAAADLAARVADHAGAASARRSVWTGRLRLAAAAAAGFLLAVSIFRPWKAPDPLVVGPVERPIAHLAVATGPVEAQLPQTMAWFECPTDSSLPPGTTVRTGPDVRCELSTADGSQLRLNGDTQVRLTDDRRVDLAGGQLWSSVSDQETPFAVRADELTVVARDCKFDLSFQADGTVLTVVAGSAEVVGPKGTTSVEAGRRLRIVEGRVEEESSLVSPVLATAWIDQVLVLKDPDDPELGQRLDELLASIGHSKATFLYEDEIRRLGDHAVLPLMKFIQSPQSQADPTRRVVAARIVADVAQPRWIPDLIELLADEDPDIRFHAAAGLQRLTARDHGLPAEAWQSQPWTSCQPVQELWRTWWSENKDRYPAGNRPAAPFTKG